MQKCNRRWSLPIPTSMASDEVAYRQLNFKIGFNFVKHFFKSKSVHRYRLESASPIGHLCEGPSICPPTSYTDETKNASYFDKVKGLYIG